MSNPTCNDIFNELLGQPLLATDDTTWRHGSTRTEVYRREEDNTFWEVRYDVSTDGETNGLREGHARIAQVEPYQVTVTQYRPIKLETKP